MDVQITYDGKTFVEDTLCEPVPGAYILYFSEYRLGSASVGKIERVDDTRIFLQDIVVGLAQPYILLKEYVDVGDEIVEEEDDNSLCTDPYESPAPEKPDSMEELPVELTPQERQLEKWTTTRIVFADNLKKGVPYAIKHKHPEEVFYGLYSGLLNPVTALFRYLSGEYKVSVQQIEAGVVEIHEIVEDKEAF
ncbi:hypothetical protein Goe2_c20800 [Bacillus phage vB_BsuM-Goe2]|uniref:Uncharacterized protein n=1 Tax=Bacillus phage vB_BsuM-Goe2 TaxID=1933062 RepID=A0A1Z1DE98_9CAUD|nr:hypothetical protein Goe2_c00600 [Bacillus phage vB_BsuM-Goe2]APZ82444.1 hypothetical protein Goe2_c20800 [Bacillus phage vB_BsuM-Goe2]